jgi:protoporphyrinogen oxidase
MRRGSAERFRTAGTDRGAWRFEHGGGHWIFGGHPDVVTIVQHLAPCERIVRRSSVYFPDDRRYVGFPLQHHLCQLPQEVAAAALAEMTAARPGAARTMADSLEQQFGSTLGALFFRPFHDAYTAGLWREVAPQDGYKTPLDLQQVMRGMTALPVAAGYNVTFLYPKDGLDALIGGLAERADLHCHSVVAGIDIRRRTIAFADGSSVWYDRLLSTLPLHRMLELTGLAVPAQSAPYTSVLVLNIGARRGPRCPADHWLYIPRSESGFHRVGFYSNVAQHFLPLSERGRDSAVSIYVERSFHGGGRPDDAEVGLYAAAVVRELQQWEFIGEVDVLDPSWVDVAYTWNRAGSPWVEEALGVLAANGIRMSGRYARWKFQGIADSLRDGLLAGQALRMNA